MLALLLVVGLGFVIAREESGQLDAGVLSLGRLAQVRVVSAAISIPVIGMWGITDSESALEFILAGARVIAVGTENFRDPRAGSEVTAGLPAALTRRGFGSLAEAQSVTFG